MQPKLRTQWRTNVCLDFQSNVPRLHQACSHGSPYVILESLVLL